eukprot:3062322-Prorocentrum_lima.AAC.1
MQLPAESFMLAGGIGGLLELADITWQSEDILNVRTLGHSVEVYPTECQNVPASAHRDTGTRNTKETL